MKVEETLQEVSKTGRGIVVQTHGKGEWRCIIQDRPRGKELSRGYGATPSVAIQAALKED